MRRVQQVVIACSAMAVLAIAPVGAADEVIRVGDALFASQQAFEESGARCGTPTKEMRELLYGVPEGGDPSDCSANSTNPTDDYDPNVLYEVEVVVHVIMDSNCNQGEISDTLIDSQIEILNEDFLAILGTNGENGTDAQIRFKLADVDPDGNPTDGITRSCNTTWFNDGGGYYNTLAWDPNRYMNVYTVNTPFLGYVPFLPADNGGGMVGGNSDRVVVLWEAFGRDAPYGPPYDQGRTLTHEVGHYLGLEHTFSGGCGNSNPPGCYSDGDLICDTNPESGPNFGCPNSFSCGSSDPTDNYMDYTDDLCMEMFTPEQVRRNRCTLEFYRPDLFNVVNIDPLTLSQPVPGDAGVDNTWSVSDAGDGDTVWLVRGAATGSTSVPGCAGVTVGINNAKPVESGVADSNGDVDIVRAVPGGFSGTVLFQAVDVDSCAVSNVISTTF